jgi:hypothetical protein
MANNTTNFPKFNERRGLYRVWVPLHDDAKAPLISIWIDPDLRAFEFCTEEKNPAGGAYTRFVPVQSAESATTCIRLTCGFSEQSRMPLHESDMERLAPARPAESQSPGPA